MESTLFGASVAEAVAEGERLPGLPLHPWIEVRIRDWFAIHQPHVLTRGGRAAGAPTVSSVRAMTTPALFDELAKFGVTLDEASFLAATDGHCSAWDLADELAEASPSGDAAPELLGLVTCELWRRLRPRRPSLEMLDELMQEGYAALERKDHDQASDLWLRFTDRFVEVLPTDVVSLDEVDEVFPGLQSVGNWIGDAQVELHNSALGKPRAARRGLRWCRQLVERFPDDPAFRDLRREEAEFHLQLGAPKRGLAIIEALREEDPNDAMTYATLADWHGHALTPRDVTRAIELLEKALARPVRNAEDWSLQGRLDELRELQRP